MSGLGAIYREIYEHRKKEVKQQAAQLQAFAKGNNVNLSISMCEAIVGRVCRYQPSTDLGIDKLSDEKKEQLTSLKIIMTAYLELHILHLSSSLIRYTNWVDSNDINSSDEKKDKRKVLFSELNNVFSKENWTLTNHTNIDERMSFCCRAASILVQKLDEHHIQEMKDNLPVGLLQTLTDIFEALWMMLSLGLYHNPIVSNKGLSGVFCRQSLADAHLNQLEKNINDIAAVTNEITAINIDPIF